MVCVPLWSWPCEGVLVMPPKKRTLTRKNACSNCYLSGSRTERRGNPYGLECDGQRPCRRCIRVCTYLSGWCAVLLVSFPQVSGMLEPSGGLQFHLLNPVLSLHQHGLADSCVDRIKGPYATRRTTRKVWCVSNRYSIGGCVRALTPPMALS